MNDPVTVPLPFDQWAEAVGLPGSLDCGSYGQTLKRVSFNSIPIHDEMCRPRFSSHLFSFFGVWQLLLMSFRSLSKHSRYPHSNIYSTHRRPGSHPQGNFFSVIHISNYQKNNLFNIKYISIINIAISPVFIYLIYPSSHPQIIFFVVKCLPTGVQY